MSEQDDWEAWAHECEARIAELEAENRKAVYGCCEECGIVRDLEQAEAALATLERFKRDVCIRASSDQEGWSEWVAAWGRAEEGA